MSFLIPFLKGGVLTNLRPCRLGKCNRPLGDEHVELTGVFHNKLQAFRAVVIVLEARSASTRVLRWLIGFDPSIECRRRAPCPYVVTCARRRLGGDSRWCDDSSFV